MIPSSRCPGRSELSQLHELIVMPTIMCRCTRALIEWNLQPLTRAVERGACRTTSYLWLYYGLSCLEMRDSITWLIF